MAAGTGAASSSQARAAAYENFTPPQGDEGVARLTQQVRAMSRLCAQALAQEREASASARRLSRSLEATQALLQLGASNTTRLERQLEENARVTEEVDRAHFHSYLGIGAGATIAGLVSSYVTIAWNFSPTGMAFTIVGSMLLGGGVGGCIAPKVAGKISPN